MAIANTTRTLATTHVTSTVWVGSGGSPVPAPSSGTRSSTNKTTLGVGIGVGVGLALVLAGAGLWWFCLRRQPGSRGPRESAAPPDQVSAPVQEVPGLIPSDKSPQIWRKPVPLQPQTTELTGEDARRELGSRQLSPPPQSIAASTPVSLAGQHEMGAELRSQELPGHTSSLPPDYSHVAVSHPGYGAGSGRGDPRWELP